MRLAAKYAGRMLSDFKGLAILSHTAQPTDRISLSLRTVIVANNVTGHIRLSLNVYDAVRCDHSHRCTFFQIAIRYRYPEFFMVLKITDSELWS